MLKRLLLLPTLIILFVSGAFASEPVSTMTAYRFQGDAPRIDGVLNENCWGASPGHESIFTQQRPNNGAPSSQRTRVQVIYSDFSVYVGARMYDSAPDSIPTELGLRDDGGKNADVFAFAIDTYHKQQNAFVFVVTSSGVQSDIYFTPGSEDMSWNAVWKSAVTIDNQGWVAEFEIPYSAIRFPQTEVQTWGINFFREIRRHREESFWNPVDPNINGFVTQFGTLTGIKGVKPPLRLSLMPYVSTYLIQQESGGNFKPTANGGMDLKYGINESFTLDMTLVPDFGQVQSDNVVLNLSPFEVYFDENRPFFTEGTELFDKGNLFYSRRVGKSFGFTGELAENEVITTNPSEAPLINATKLSGRTSKGLGIGLFNALTNQTFATIEDTLKGGIRTVMADPLTNFNVLVFDQNLKNNSNISFINTNVMRSGEGRDANVSGTNFAFYDKTNTYTVRGDGALSQIFSRNEDDGQTNLDLGHRYEIELARVSGNFRYGIQREVTSDTYTPNDLGFLRANNQIEHDVEFGYRKNEPFGKFNRFFAEISLGYNQIYRPRMFHSFSVRGFSHATWKNFWSSGFHFRSNPSVTNDNFEARTEGYLFKRPANYSLGTFMNTDSRKPLQFSFDAGAWTRPEWEQWDYWLGFGPRYRFNDRLNIRHRFSLNRSEKERGFANKLYDDQDELQEIVFGQRKVQTVINTLSGNYTFNNMMGLSLRVRHYWSTVEYDRFFELKEDGHLYQTDYTGLDDQGDPQHNTNFNAFNIDLVYSWQFAPGSFLNAVWKNAIYTSDIDTDPGFFTNFGNTISSPQVNSFSLRVIYYLDFLDVKRVLKRGKSG